MELKKAPYAFLGTGQLAVEKAQVLAGKARTMRNGPSVAKAYDDLARRGEKVVNRVQRSVPAKRAAEGTRQATRQLKGAVTSIRKAVGLEDRSRTSR